MMRPVSGGAGLRSCAQGTSAYSGSVFWTNHCDAGRFYPAGRGVSGVTAFLPMLVHLLKSKIHRATVTASSVDYEGSLTIAEDLIEKAGLFPFERILCSNMANGARWETYVIRGPRGSGAIELNGAVAHLGKPGDTICPDCQRLVIGHNPKPPPNIPYADEAPSAATKPAITPAPPSKPTPTTTPARPG